MTTTDPQSIRFLSVCAGIEAASEAWRDLPFAAAGLCEIEPFPCCVLAHRHGASRPLHMLNPDEPGIPPEERARRANAIAAVAHLPERAALPNLGDMSRFDEWPADLIDLADVDLLVGGPPCQAFSVAGLRKSLEDARGSLSLTYIKLLDRIDEKRDRIGRPPAVCLWENVPGVLNTADNAFGCFLGGLAGADGALEPPDPEWGWPSAGFVAGPVRAVAWRILDAQHFGVAQRRRRVFVVASARKGFAPEAVLFESEGVRRDTPPRRRQGEPGPAGAAPGAGGDGGAGAPRGPGGAGDGDGDGDVAGTLTNRHNPSTNQDARAGNLIPVVEKDVSATVCAKWDHSGGPAGNEHHNLVAMVPKDVKAFPWQSALDPIGKPGDISPTLIKNQTVAVAIQTTQAKQNGTHFTEERSPTLTREGEPPAVATIPIEQGNQGAGGNVGFGKDGDPSYTLNASGRGHAVAQVPRDEIAYGRPVETTGHQGDHVVGEGDVAGCLSAQGGNNGGGAGQFLHTKGSEPSEPRLFSTMPMRSGKDFKTREVQIAQPLMAAGPGGGNQGGDVVLHPETPCVDMGGGKGQGRVSEGVAPTLNTSAAGHVILPPPEPMCDLIPALHTLEPSRGDGREDRAVGHAGHVRRLTPVECERLQGFPDNHTLIPGPWRPRQGPDRDETIAYLVGAHGLSLADAELLADCPDGPRYKACGNSMCTNVMKFVGRRISEALRRIGGPR